MGREGKTDETAAQGEGQRAAEVARDEQNGDGPRGKGTAWDAGECMEAARL